MFEYLKTKQADTSKRGISHSVAQQRAIPDRNSYADRFAKPRYYPIREMGSVIQMERCLICGETHIGCECGEDFEPDDSNDSTYCENTHEQYLNPRILRSNLGGTGKSGEAHHILPGNVVKKIKWVNDGNKDQFNLLWNGIMLHGSKVGSNEYIHLLKGWAPNILHRHNNQPCHNDYDNEVSKLINKRQPEDIDQCKQIAARIEAEILLSNADCLDHLSLASAIAEEEWEKEEESDF